MANHSHSDVEINDTHHVIPLSVYNKVFAALFVLFILTVAAAYVDLTKYWEPLNIIVAMTIAVAKALLIILYFMHVRFSSKLTQLFAMAAFIWLGILFLFTMGDYFSRPMLPDPQDFITVVKDPELVREGLQVKEPAKVGERLPAQSHAEH
jgi:cytochrome c oxidase subunit 4